MTRIPGEANKGTLHLTNVIGKKDCEIGPLPSVTGSFVIEDRFRSGVPSSSSIKRRSDCDEIDALHEVVSGLVERFTRSELQLEDVEAFVSPTGLEASNRRSTTLLMREIEQPPPLVSLKGGELRGREEVTRKYEEMANSALECSISEKVASMTRKKRKISLEAVANERLKKKMVISTSGKEDDLSNIQDVHPMQKLIKNEDTAAVTSVDSGNFRSTKATDTSITIQIGKEVTKAALGGSARGFGGQVEASSLVQIDLDDLPLGTSEPIVDEVGVDGSDCFVDARSTDLALGDTPQARRRLSEKRDGGLADEYVAELVAELVRLERVNQPESLPLETLKSI